MMQKLAETKYPIHDLLRQRWSPRAFADRAVEPEKIRSLLEAARWAPSSYNEQPWNFIVATKEDRQEYDRLLSCLVEGNIRWAQHAPVLMLSVAKLASDRSGKPNRHAFHDVGLAVENLVIQGMALGLFVHQIAGFHVDRARDLFGIPDSHEPVTAITLGYPGDPAALPEDLRERELVPRSRKPLQDFVFAGRWGHSLPLVTEEAIQ
jgi:nitroreductase